MQSTAANFRCLCQATDDAPVLAWQLVCFEFVLQGFEVLQEPNWASQAASLSPHLSFFA